MIELIAETLGAQVLLVEPGSEQEVEFLAMLTDDYDEDDALLEPRPPVVTVLGHVDHGKTTLLDTIRHANVVAGEAGGITQRIGAYRVLEHDDGDRSSPSSTRRATRRSPRCVRRGAQVTDIAVLVVAADDGVMPQTVEAINHAKAAEVPIVVAVTKTDREDADPTRVRQQLTENELVPRGVGRRHHRRRRGRADRVRASTRCSSDHRTSPTSYLGRRPRRQPQEAGASPSCSRPTSTRAAAPSSTVLVEEGTLRVGDTIVAGGAWGRVRAMFDEHGQHRRPKPGLRCRSRCSGSTTCRWRATNSASHPTTSGAHGGRSARAPAPGRGPRATR